MLKRGRVRLLPSSNMNKGPGRLSLNTRYGKMPLRGQMMLLVTPRYILTPLRKGSVLDCLMINFSCLGLSRLSMEIRYRSITTSFLHAWTRVAPRSVLRGWCQIFAWKTYLPRVDTWYFHGMNRVVDTR